MLFRFCLYGFLKNQRYFEPFFMLALLAHGLSYFEIGLLYSCRSLTLNALEIPSGVIADQWGRRGSMIGSFVAYVFSFLMFAFVDRFVWLMLAMVLYGVGDSFRTGTHKAMIFQWLRNEGRQDERTQVYGFTRSWSQIGSAISAIIAALFVIASGDYRTVFLVAIIPYLLNIVNFLGYPVEVDGAGDYQAAELRLQRSQADGNDTPRLALGRVWSLICTTLLTVRDAVMHRRLRGLIVESMAWEGIFGAVKDYLQPALLAFVLMNLGHSLANHPSGAEVDTTVAAPVSKLTVDANSGASPTVVWTISLTYTALFLLSGWASRSAHTWVARAGSHSRASHWLWYLSIGCYGLLGLSDWIGWTLCVVLSFVALNILENVWRPILISRFDDHSEAHLGATILSIESQSQRIATLVVAPLVGWSIDALTRNGGPGQLWPIGVVGAVAGLGALWSSCESRDQVDGRAADPKIAT